jgi:hypothetical protein
MPIVKFVGFKVKNYCQPQTLRQKITRTRKNPQQKASRTAVFKYRPNIKIITTVPPPTTLNSPRYKNTLHKK